MHEDQACTKPCRHPRRAAGRADRRDPCPLPVRGTGMVAEVVRAVLAAMRGDLTREGDRAALGGRGAGPHHRRPPRRRSRRCRSTTSPPATSPSPPTNWTRSWRTPPRRPTPSWKAARRWTWSAETSGGRGGGAAAGRHHADLRGLQLPGHHRPAHHQGGGDAEDDRGRRWRRSSPPSATARRRRSGPVDRAGRRGGAAERPATAGRGDGPVGHRPAAGELRLMRRPLPPAGGMHGRRRRCGSGLRPGGG